MTDDQNWGQAPQHPPQGYGQQYPPQGYGQQYPQGPWQAQAYDPASHAQRIGAGQEQGPWQQYPPQYDPRGAQQWGQPPQQQRKRSWPRRHKILSALITFGVLLIAVVVLSSIPSGSAAPASTAGIAACTSHHAVTTRRWLEIAKDPDAAKGQCITVYGQITQFDADTGSAEFRASVGGAHIAPAYGFVNYPTNVMVDGSSTALGSLVEGDLFTAQVTIAGDQEYTTLVGGDTDVPLLRADSVTRTGHLSS